MLLNRRQMLTYSLATVAMTLTGCKSQKTIVIVVNRTNLNMDGTPSGVGGKLSVLATASEGGKNYKFNKKNIKVGKDAKQTYRAKADKGTVVDFEIQSLKVDGHDVDVGVAGFEVVVGYSNRFVVYADGAERTSPAV